ncbi:dihydrodipicolinate synthase family protein [Tautonia rosea]|uniref:dihydrodipicolinate synthase family protein n=1 Tax=Tautonia rosea TaxID=2728037 RepID=UPI0014732028|nr:dihydrodipicolinate synthase family protein [Tautonia rosea]
MELDLELLSTVQLVPPSPFSQNGQELLPEVLEDFLREVHRHGIRVVLPGAGTGEFHSLSSTEVVSCVRATRNAIGREGIVVAPIGLGVSHALETGKGAIEVGADALLIMPPVHPYLSDEGVRDYFQYLMKRLPKPFLVYKKGPYPSDTLLEELGETDQFIGVKYAVNDLDAFTRFASRVEGRMGLYCGTAERFAPFFHLAGATGYTSGAGNLCPRLTLALHEALSEHRFQDAMRLLSILRPIEDARARSSDSYNISLLKAGLRLLGRDFGPPRPPQRQLTDEEVREIKKFLEPILEAEAALGR